MPKRAKLVFVKNRPLNGAFVIERAAAIGINSKAELSNETRIERSVLTRLISGERLARPSHVLAISSVLKVRPSEIVLPDDAADLDGMTAA